MGVKSKLVIALCIAYLMGITVAGCGDRGKNPISISDGSLELSIGFFKTKTEPDGKISHGGIAYIGTQRQAHLLESIDMRLAAFRQLGYELRGRKIEVRIYVDLVNGPGTAPMYNAVPCGIPNGGSCYSMSHQRILVAAAEHDIVMNFCHELFHAYLEQNPGEYSLVGRHLDPRWSGITRADMALNAILIQKHK